MLVQENRRIRNLLKAYVGAVVEAVEKGEVPFSLRHLFAASAISELSTQGSSPRMYSSKSRAARGAVQEGFMQCYSASRANFIHFKADALHLSVRQIQVRCGELELFFVFQPEKTIGGQLLR